MSKEGTKLVRALRIDAWVTDGRRVVWANNTQPAHVGLDAMIGEAVAAVSKNHGGDGWRLMVPSDLGDNEYGDDGWFMPGVWAALYDVDPKDIEAGREKFGAWTGSIWDPAGPRLVRRLVKADENRARAQPPRK
jgi:hypothetical protein